MVRSTVWLGVIFVINETLLSVPTMHNHHPPTGRHQRRNNVDIEIRDKWYRAAAKKRERSDLAACRTPTVGYLMRRCSSNYTVQCTPTASTDNNQVKRCCRPRARTHHRNPNWDWSRSSDTCGRAERSSSASYIGRVKLLSPARAASPTAILFYISTISDNSFKRLLKTKIYYIL